MADIYWAKLDTPLVMAFDLSDGPFEVVINWAIQSTLSKEEILELTAHDCIQSIWLDRRIEERRWRER